MFDLLRAGNFTFTVPTTIVAVLVLAVAIRTGIRCARGESVAAGNRWLFHLGLFAFVFGMLSQGISLYQMMEAIQAAGGVSPAVIAGGLQVSFIVPIYGLLVFAVALSARIGLEVAEGRLGRG